MRSKLRLIIPLLALCAVMLSAGCSDKGKIITNPDHPTATPTATPTVTETPTPTPTEVVAPTEVPVLYEAVRDTDESAFLYINEKLSGLDTLTVDVFKMANYQNGAIYQVTLLKKDGTYEERDITENDGKIVIDVKDAVKAEVSPVFSFVFGLMPDNVKPSDIAVSAKCAYTLESPYGFCGNVSNSKNNVQFSNSEACFVVVVPEGFYNVTLVKAGENRSLVVMDGGVLGCNVGIPGAGGRTGSKPIEYYMEDVRATGGTLRLGMGEKASDPARLEIRRSATIKPRKTHIYLAGDSTCSAYYPLEIKEPDDGRYQTGWGQVLCQYITDDVAITNLGSGGTCAKTWHDIAFNGVLQHGCPGDIFIIMHGINDQSYSSVEEMKTCLSQMVDECRKKGLIPVLCTPMQTAKFWKSSTGKDLSNFEEPRGGGKAAFMQGIRDVAASEGTFLIDVAEITSKEYGILGKDYVTKTFHLYKGNKEEDTLHLSYAGAKNVASIIASELYKLQATGVTDVTGEKIAGITFNPVTTRNISYTDKDGNEAILQLIGPECIYRKYAVR